MLRHLESMAPAEQLRHIASRLMIRNPYWQELEAADAEAHKDSKCLVGLNAKQATNLTLNEISWMEQLSCIRIQ